MLNALKIKYLNESLCLMPWVSSNISPKGDYNLCCLANIFLSNEGKPYNAEFHGVDEVRNCQFLKNIRITFLTGKYPPCCFNCWDKEKLNIKSKRIFTFDLVKNEVLKNLTEKTNPDGSINPEDFPIVQYDVRLGNLCNSKCIMCSDVYSSLHANGKQHKWMDNFRDTKYYKDVRNKAKDIVEIYLTGGEPFINKHHWDFIDYLIESGESEHIALIYNSNGSIMKQKFIDKWRKFKRVLVLFSVDCIGEVFEKIRPPLKWKEVEKNIIFFDKQTYSQHTNIQGMFSPTVFSVNLLHMHEFGEWFLFRNFKNIKYFNTNILYSPPQYSIINKSHLYDKAYKLFEPFLDGPLFDFFDEILNYLIIKNK